MFYGGDPNVDFEGKRVAFQIEAAGCQVFVDAFCSFLELTDGHLGHNNGKIYAVEVAQSFAFSEQFFEDVGEVFEHRISFGSPKSTVDLPEAVGRKEDAANRCFLGKGLFEGTREQHPGEHHAIWQSGDFGNTGQTHPALVLFIQLHHFLLEERDRLELLKKQ